MPHQNSLILTSKTNGINAIYYITTSKNRNYSCMNSAEVDNLSGINNILFISSMERDIVDISDNLILQMRTVSEQARLTYHLPLITSNNWK